jgi:NADPH-ferrihemoprotein reductase
MDTFLQKHHFLVTLQGMSHVLSATRLGDWIVILALFWAFCFRLGDGKIWARPDQNQYKWYEAPQKTGDLKAKSKQTRNIGERLQQIGCDIAILWGSQSGVSESFAERLARQWQARFALKTLVADLDDYDASSLSGFPAGKLCVFLCSTYGEGDPPDNAVNFCVALERMRKRGTRVEGLRYLALGMGNRNYKHYNQVIVVSAELTTSMVRGS